MDFTESVKAKIFNILTNIDHFIAQISGWILQSLASNVFSWDHRKVGSFFYKVLLFSRAIPGSNCVHPTHLCSVPQLSCLRFYPGAHPLLPVGSRQRSTQSPTRFDLKVMAKHASPKLLSIIPTLEPEIFTLRDPVLWVRRYWSSEKAVKTLKSLRRVIL